MEPDPSRLPRWGFALPGPVRDELTALALSGTKTTTAALLVEMELDEEVVPAAGDRAVLVDSAERPVAIVETVTCHVLRLADVDDRHAVDEGEGYRDAREFRVSHERFWGSSIDDLRARLGDPSFAITDDTPIVAERFRVVARLEEPQGEVALVPVHPDGVPPLAAVLARAFAHDPMVTWPLGVAPGMAAMPDRVRAMFELVDTDFAREGWMWSAAEGLGVMTLLPPGSAAREAALAAAAAHRIARLCADGGSRYERFWAWVGSLLPAEPHWLLDQLAVEPDAHGRGIGGALIRHAAAIATADGRPLMLETGVERNLGLYARHGFRIVGEADAPGGGPRVWFLRRDPGPIPEPGGCRSGDDEAVPLPRRSR